MAVDVGNGKLIIRFEEKKHETESEKGDESEWQIFKMVPLITIDC